MANPKFRLSGRHAEVDTSSGDVAERPFCAEGWSVRAARTRCLSSSRRLQVKHKVPFREATNGDTPFAYGRPRKPIGLAQIPAHNGGKTPVPMDTFDP
jgi:hypothetical protein